ncbi:MAG: tRNA uridine-5-carboxymethylaminomethyl(34) synthesis GTPase MnmE [Phyllobacteriaceae bacterium]|nr:tRNA uridine-5-carboxymethylaminomethyl(34) synthesis GTPase MnmE [Phyllobacteriaceae bacterium]
MGSLGRGGGATICALSSGRLPSGVAVVRISGRRAFEILEAMTGGLGEPGRARLTSIRCRNGEILDRGLVLAFKSPASFTGEDVVEIHFHGGPAVVRAGLAEICRFPDTRIADAGEFTRRAFVNGKLDLVSAENLADLVWAETETQRRLAIANANGESLALYGDWRRLLIEARALIEAELDFSEEEDVPGSVRDACLDTVKRLVTDIDKHREGYRRAELIRNGFRIVLLGEPNAGKSSLLNALAGRDAAIVSAEPGTTRDLIEVSLELSGLKVVITDTAGLREGGSTIEVEGMSRARARAKEADLVLWLKSPSCTAAPPDELSAVVVETKADLRTDPGSCESLRVSSKTGEGLDHLLDFLGRRASEATSGSDASPTHWRQAELLRIASEHLHQATSLGLAPEVVAEHLRIGSENLGRVVGDIDVEDMLDMIFSRFCVGK